MTLAALNKGNNRRINKGISTALKNSRGFTLVELVTVIMLLGIISISAGGIIKLASQIFVDVSNRDELIATVRFSVERMNRELREALPNSVRVIVNSQGDQCLQYIPVRASTIYLDIPVTPKPANNLLSVVRFDDTLYSNRSSVVVYPLSPNDVYDTSEKRYPVDISYALPTTGNVWTLKLQNSVKFKEDSPTQRLFLVDEPVSYCASNGALTRYSRHGYNSDILTGDAVLMSNDLVVTGTIFQVDDANLHRNALIHINLQFSRNDEVVNFYNEVQVKNVP